MEDDVVIVGVVLANAVIFIGHIFNLIVSMRRLRDDKPVSNSHIAKTVQETLGGIIDELRERNKELEEENKRIKERCKELENP